MFYCFRVRHNDDLKVRGSTVAVNLKLWLLCGSSYQAGIFKTDSSKYFSSFEILYTLLNYYSHNAGIVFLFLSIWLIGLAAIRSQILHFSAFCLNVMPSIFSSFKLPKSGPLFSLQPWETNQSFNMKDWLLRTFSTDSAVRVPVWKFL